MTLTEQLTWLADADNVAKVRQLLCKAAIAVAAEEAATAHHQTRSAYSFAVLGNPVAAGQAAAYAVATNSGLTTTPSDSDLEFTVNSMFNAFAGVTT
jgi:hypothetical protein